MKIRNAVLAIATTTLLGTSAFAATTKTDDCASLQKEVNAAIAANGNGPSISKAREHASKGTTLCNEGKKADGMKQLHEAMKEASVKAK